MESNKQFDLFRALEKAARSHSGFRPYGHNTVPGRFIEWAQDCRYSHEGMGMMLKM